MKRAFLAMLVLSFTSCASYYKANLEFNQNFETGQLEKANKLLNKNRKKAEKKAKFLYFVNKGVVESMLGNYDSSNNWFEKAYIFGEDYKKKAGNVAASFLVNPNVLIYPGEDHEHLLLLYYKAMNFLKMGDRQSALVECRRLTNRLNELSDKYRSENKYKEDAFIQNLIGIIYESYADYNNAFIAYRNSYNTYNDVYEPMFGVSAPDQLKRDLIRSAQLIGFVNEVEFYKKEFGMEDYSPIAPESELVFFWQNGLGPVKDEWSLNFSTGGYSNGFYTFQDQTGRIHTVVCSSAQANQLSGLSVVRIAFPIYVERQPIFHQADLHHDGQMHEVELAQDINQIAKKTLDERMAAEIGKGLLRFALKKVIEQQARNQDDRLGLLMTILNAATEKADTRNWQTIPYAIHYARVPLKEGANNVTFRASGPTDQKKETFHFEGKKGKTVFHTYQSFDSFNQ